jgi:hypothetical protein
MKDRQDSAYSGAQNKPDHRLLKPGRSCWTLGKKAGIDFSVEVQKFEEDFLESLSESGWRS